MGSLIVSWCLLVTGITIVLPRLVWSTAADIRRKKAAGPREIIDSVDYVMNDNKVLLIMEQIGWFLMAIGILGCVGSLVFMSI
jgi:predicted MFS family arabinose efflux permease